MATSGLIRTVVRLQNEGMTIKEALNEAENRGIWSWKSILKKPSKLSDSTLRRRALRREAIKNLGGKCIYCGCGDPAALEINHKNGGGNKELKNRGRWNVYMDIFGGKRNDLELACRVCNSVHYLKELKGLKGNWEVKYSVG